MDQSNRCECHACVQARENQRVADQFRLSTYAQQYDTRRCPFCLEMQCNKTHTIC